MTSTLRRSVAPVAAAVALAILAGCSSAASEQELGLLRVDAPLREPVWVPKKEVLLALGEDGRRVVRVDVGGVKPGSPVAQASVRSEVFADVGENLALNPEEPGLAYLPRPRSGRVSALDTESLRVVGGYDVGDAPSYATVDVQSELLFALSEAGSIVSGVGIEGSEEVPATEVEGGTETVVESPEKGLDPAFWVAGPGGVAFYGGDPPERLVGRPLEAADIAVDLTSAQRTYVAEGERVVALEGDPQDYLEGELLVDATRGLGESAEHLASDELHVFAATRSKLVAMRRESLQVAESVRLDRFLEREGVSPDGVSGITVGTEHIYLTLEGAPYVLSVKKP
jgi:hypothetical protein